MKNSDRVTATAKPNAPKLGEIARQGTGGRSLMSEPLSRYEQAAKDADWEQVVLNGGPPCFHVGDDGTDFCLRAERWHDTPVVHRFVSLTDLLTQVAEQQAARVEQLERELTKAANYLVGWKERAEASEAKFTAHIRLHDEEVARLAGELKEWREGFTGKLAGIPMVASPGIIWNGIRNLTEERDSLAETIEQCQILLDRERSGAPLVERLKMLVEERDVLARRLKGVGVCQECGGKCGYHGYPHDEKWHTCPACGGTGVRVPA